MITLYTYNGRQRSKKGPVSTLSVPRVGLVGCYLRLPANLSGICGNRIASAARAAVALATATAELSNFHPGGRRVKGYWTGNGISVAALGCFKAH